jgi:hypothetical protein
MRRRTIVSIVTLLVGGLLVGRAPAQAPLGFSIDPTEGFPGDVVNGMVNTEDVAANCATTV